MADQRELAILRTGADAWLKYWRTCPGRHPDLRGADLTGCDLEGVYLRGVDLSDAKLTGANLGNADLKNTKLSGANLSGADLRHAVLTSAQLIEASFDNADLSNAHLSGVDSSKATFRRARLPDANLSEAWLWNSDFTGADLRHAWIARTNLEKTVLTNADLSGSDLSGAILVGTTLDGATLDGCRVFGTAVWECKLDGTKQSNLIITPEDEPDITVDNLKVAQFIYLLLNNSEIREVIDSIASKVVLIIGRFTPERKRILDSIRAALRKYNYTPVIFDFARPASKSFIETVNTLAGMARFVIADVTEPRVVLQELHSIVREFPSVPIQPLLLAGAEVTPVLADFMQFATFLPIHQYNSCDELLAQIEERIIAPAESKVNEIGDRRIRADQMLAELQGRP